MNRQTCKGLVSFIGVEGSGGREEDGRVEVADDAGNGVGRVLLGVSVIKLCFFFVASDVAK
jgi:hypothetical protein